MISDSSKRIAMSKRGSMDVTKWDELYNESDKYNKNTKKDLKDDEREMLRNSKEYSFQPNSNSPRYRKSMQNMM